MKNRKANLLLRGFVVVAGLLALYLLELTASQQVYFIERRGELVEIAAGEVEHADSRIAQNLTLTSSSGLSVDVRAVRPAASESRPVPVLLLAGGQRTGKYAADVARDSGKVAFVAIDYPYHGPGKINGIRQSLLGLRALQRGVLDTPPAILLTIDWLAAQPWADARQIELVGVSLGVPFMAIAGALDESIPRVWLVQGAGDNVAWVENALPSRIEGAFTRRLAARALLLFGYGASLDTPMWVSNISPRPVIVVSSRNDEFVPAGAALADADLPENAEIIWTESRHIRPSRQDIVGELMQIVQARLEATEP